GGVGRRVFDGFYLTPVGNPRIFLGAVPPRAAAGPPAVARDVNEAVVAARPDDAFLHRRFGQREDRAVILDARVVFGDRAARRAEFGFVVARQVGADNLPALALVVGFEEDVAGGVERVRIIRGKQDREVPLEAILHALGAPAHRVIGPDVDVALLPGVVIEPSEQAAVIAAEDDVGVFRVRLHPARFAPGRLFPIFRGN